MTSGPARLPVSRVLIPVGLALVGLLLYLPLAASPPLLDDSNEFEAIRNAPPGAAISYRSAPDAFHPAANLVRYLVARTAGTPAALRALSAGLHGLTVFLVFLLVRRLVRGRGEAGSSLIAPAAAALIFAVHPLAAEAVLSQSAFPMVLGTAFLVSAALAAAWSRKEAPVLFLASLLCQPALWPVGLILPAVTRRASGAGEERKGGAGPLAPYAGASILAYLLWSARAWPTLRFAPFHQPWEFFRGVASQSAAFLTDLRLLILPSGLSLDHWSPVHGGEWSLQAITGLLLILALLAGAFLLRRSRGTLGIAMAWLALPQVHLLLLAPEIPVWERRLYAALVPAALAAGACARVLERRLGPRAAFAGAALAAIPLVLVTAERGRLWRDPIALWESAARVNAMSPRGHLAVANLHVRAGRLDDALRSFEAALSRAPDSATIQTSIAEIHFQKGDYLAALREADKAMEIDPSHVPAYITAGNSFMARNQIDDAFMFYNEALRLEEDNPSALFNLGTLLFQQRRFGGAVELLERANERRPGDAAILFRLGMSRLNVGDLAGAGAALEECLAADPARVEASINLATLLTRLEEHEEARSLLERVLERSPGNAQALNGLAVIASAAEDWEEARRLFGQAVAADPGNLRLMFNLAGAHEHLGELDRAAQVYETILDSSKGDLGFSEEVRTRLAQVEERLRG